MKNKEAIERLLGQIIQVSESRNFLDKEKNPELTGEDWITFHLKKLKELIDLED